MKKRLLCLVMVCCSLALPVSAMQADSYRAQLEEIGGTELYTAMPPESVQYLEQTTPTVNLDVGKSVITLLSRSQAAQGAAMHAALRSLLRVMIILILVACVSGFQALSAGESASIAVSLAGALGVSTVLMADVNGLFALCTQTLEQVSVFSKSMLPIMAAAISLAGAPTTAAILQTATMMSFDLVVRFVSAVLVPAVGAYIAIITVNAALGNDMLMRMAGFVKWLVTSSMKLIMTLFIAYITVSGSLGGSADGVTLKAAKMAVSGAVPVVGGIISDATETMLSGALLLKNTVGVFGMLCIAAICIVPFLKVGINYLLFKAGTAVLSPICNNSLIQLVGGIGDSFGLLLGMLGTCSAILFFELVFSVAMVKPI